MSTPKTPRCPACGKPLGGMGYNDMHPGHPLWYECRTENCPLFGLEGFAWHWRYIALQAQLVKDLEAYVMTLRFPSGDNADAYFDADKAWRDFDATRAELAKLERVGA